MLLNRIFSSLLLTLIIFSCQDSMTTSDKEAAENPSNSPLFELVPASKSGITFSNQIVENDTLNYFRFMHLYMGAGLAVGDLNNDGFPDLFFTSNIDENKLFLNKGNLEFEDISTTAKINDRQGFTTGVSMADVNNDGWLDIYVCKSGWFKDPRKKQNLLYINNGNLTFSEKAVEYGVADYNNSIQSSFFDYDQDGDLDLFVINTPVYFQLTTQLYPLDQIHQSQDLRQFGGYDKLFRNDGAQFTDVTQQSGILSDIGFGLSLLTVDVNQDGWTDIYIANDFMTPDYLYINQKNGTFSEQKNQYFKHTSFYSMGSDAADINNDGFTDLIALDMLPADYKRSKTTMEMVQPKHFFQSVDWGYNHQYMHNMLHLNNGNGTFREIGQLAGITKTDWSWTPLLADLDNDGYRDIFISNGIQRDVTERDHRSKIQNLQQQGGKLSFSQIQNLIPSQKIPNYAFRNKGNLTFQDVSDDWGIAIPSFSNGAVVADLDKDGDLDIVTNNVNEVAFLYENKANQRGNNYLRITLKGSPQIQAINTKVSLQAADGTIIQHNEFITTRGYFSSSEQAVHFGLGTLKEVPIVEITWIDGKKSIFKNVKANQQLVVDYAQAEIANTLKTPYPTLFSEITSFQIAPVFQHTENEHDDFKNQILLPHRQSQNGPSIAVQDVNGDGFEDFYIGGAHQQAGALYLQDEQGKFSNKNVPAFEKDKNHEDLGTLFFDADGDGDADLYVVSGGNEFPENAPNYQDRLYLNDGKGNYTRAENHLPTLTSSGSCVAGNDFDGDGDIDLFVGGRVIPDRYPFPPQSYILKNEGGKFSEATEASAPSLSNIGMVTSAIWSDFSGDGKPDLMVVGEWMKIELFENQNGKLAHVTPNYGLEKTTGWWNKIIATDYDGDGDTDYIAGNLGLNYKFHASDDKPFDIYCSDFDENGSYDVVLAKNIDDQYFPIRGRTCSSEQMPFIKEKFPTFNAFADADITDIYGTQNLDAALHYQAHLFESIILKNNGGQFEIMSLPLEAQTSPINGIIAHDFDADGQLDLVIGGNHYGAEVETTRADAGIGLFLKGNAGSFSPWSLQQSGFFAAGDVKDLKSIQLANGQQGILVANNNAALKLFVQQ